MSADHPVPGQGFEGDPRKRRSSSGSVPEWFANLLPERGSGLRGVIDTELITETVRGTAEALASSRPGIKRDLDVPESLAATIDARLASLPVARG